jgi:hypothetical protein
MMRKRQAVHCSGHLEVGEQYVDAAGMASQEDQGGLGVLGFYDLETFIEQRLNNNEPDQLFVLGDEDKYLIWHIRYSRFRHAPVTACEARKFPQGWFCEINWPALPTALLRLHALIEGPRLRSCEGVRGRYRMAETPSAPRANPISARLRKPADVVICRR